MLVSYYPYFFQIFLLLQLAYLPDRKREYLIDDEDGRLDSELSAEGRLDSSSLDEPLRFDKRSRKSGMLGWFKLRVSNHLFFVVQPRMTLS